MFLLLLVVPQGTRFDVTFYVLEHLSCPVILGDDTVYCSKAFVYQSAFYHNDQGLDEAELNAIVWFKCPERLFSRQMREISDLFHPKGEPNWQVN